METARSNPSNDVVIDQAPLLGNHGEERNGGRRASVGFREAARFIRRASGRRLMREPSMLVREAASEQLEERRSDWAYSKPVVVLDMMWNLALVTVAAVVLVLSRNEAPSMPLRLWIMGYALQCAFHTVCVYVEYRKRRVPRGTGLGGDSGSGRGNHAVSRDVANEEHRGRDDSEQDQEVENTGAVKNLESANTMFSFVWWIMGFYWVSTGGETLIHDAPQLYWLCIVFLALDVFFVVICVALACVAGIAVCCCLPCIIAILYAVSDQEGATDEDICQLPKYKFRISGDTDKLDGDLSGCSGGVMIEWDTETPNEHVLSAEDAECCICLSAYSDGAELRELPCNHHFHAGCIDKWLYINATCPLCKYNIIKNGNCGSDV